MPTSLGKRSTKLDQNSSMMKPLTYLSETATLYNTLSNFQTITEEELFKTIKTMNSTTCSNDPCSTKFILSFSQILVPMWNNMINKSIVEGIVLQNQKEAIILPIQKKS